MKAKIVDGVLILSSENETEAFALKCFKEKAYVSIRDETTNTDGYWLGDKIEIVNSFAQYTAGGASLRGGAQDLMQGCKQPLADNVSLPFSYRL